MEEMIDETIADDGGLRKYLKDSVALLRLIRSTFGDLADDALKDALRGDEEAIKALSEKHTELAKALKRALEAEDNFNAWQAKQSGADTAGDIDFDAIRAEIGCRLARLRECD